MGMIPSRDVRLLHWLRDNAKLRNISPWLANIKQGMMVLTCSDGDQMFDLYFQLGRVSFQASVFARYRLLAPLFSWMYIFAFLLRQIVAPRMHVLALNGGPILLSERWPTHEESVVFRRHIMKAHELKQLSTILLIAHAPCGAAGAAHISIEEQLDYHFEAKQEVLNLSPVFKVVCCLHVDWPRRRWLRPVVRTLFHWRWFWRIVRRSELLRDALYAMWISRSWFRKQRLYFISRKDWMEYRRHGLQAVA